MSGGFHPGASTVPARGSPPHLVELLLTVGALVLLVCVVGLQVAHLGGGVREGAATVVALVGLLTTVHQLVALQVAGSGEELATVFAAVLGLPRVALPVQVQQADQAVALATLLTAVRLQGAGRGQAGKPTMVTVWLQPQLVPAPRSTLLPEHKRSSSTGFATGYCNGCQPGPF